METTRPSRDPAAVPEDPSKPGPSATLTVLGGSDPVPESPQPSHTLVPRGVWAQTVGVFVFVAGLGVAEVRLLGMPGWLGVVFVVLGCAMAIDRIQLASRAGPADDAPAHEPLRLARPREPEPEPEPRVAADEDVPAAASAADPDPGPRSARPALGYTCVPGRDQGGALADDRRRITDWCAEGGLPVGRIVHDVEGQSGEREGGPALRWALDQIATGEADTLVVARLRNLSPTVANLPPLLRWFTEPERRLIAIDLRLDTATDSGRLAATALAGVGSWENERLSARTRRGLEAARSRGAGRAGAAVADVPELRTRIVEMRNAGMTLQAIADVLNEEGVPTLRGGAKWRPSSVHGATGYRRPASTRGIRVPAKSPGPQQRSADEG